MRQLLAGFESPAGSRWSVSYGLRWREKASERRGPYPVVIGGKDVQIDVQADGVPLQEAAAGIATVTFAFPPLANHVLK